MAKTKRKEPTGAGIPTGSTFNPASFRRGEEESMASFPGAATPVVDEQTVIQGRGDFPSKSDISAETARLGISIDAAINQAANDLNAILQQIADDNAAAEAAMRAAEEAALLAAQQEEEGDILVEQAIEGEITAFNLDPNAVFSSLTPTQQARVSKGMFGGNPALTALYSSLAAIGVEGLVDVLNSIREQYPDISSDDALLLLKYDKRFNEPYQRRFAGNKARMAAGLAPLDDATYLANEAAYKKIFQAYGLKQFMNTEKYANFIGNDIAPDEIAERVSMVYTRVNNAMPQVQKALLQFYPELTTQDLMAYTLDPTNQLPVIQRKIQAAEIGGAALAQNLGTSLQATTFAGTAAAPYTNVSRGTIGVEAMMRSGADAEAAAKASAYVADVLPVSEKLSSIYAGGYQQYGQLQAEQEAYQGSITAKKARETLVARERAEFAGQSGVLKSQRRATGGLI